MSFWLVKCQNNLPKSIRAPAIPAAVVDFVNSQTVKHEKGTRHEPRNVQNWKRGNSHQTPSKNKDYQKQIS